MDNNFIFEIKNAGNYGFMNIQFHTNILNIRHFQLFLIQRFFKFLNYNIDICIRYLNI